MVAYMTVAMMCILFVSGIAQSVVGVDPIPDHVAGNVNGTVAGHDGIMTDLEIWTMINIEIAKITCLIMIEID